MRHKAMRAAAPSEGAAVPVASRTNAKRKRDKRRSYNTIPVWVARITEHVHANGVHRINVVTKGGKPRTLKMKR